MSTPRSVTLVGLGLMGGSLARALRGIDRPPRIAAWTATGIEPRAAFAAGVIDAAPRTLAEALEGADLVVVATPVGATLALLPDILERAPEHAVVTDVCSLKAPICEAVAALAFERFAGAHPMAGSHESGWAAARADLYHGAVVWVTPAAPGPAAAVRSLWSALGAHPESIDPGVHDALMARVSHVPQVLASTLAAGLRDAGITRASLGPGGRDMTRLAASDPALWSDLLAHSPHVVPALRGLSDRLARLADALAAGDSETVSRCLEAGREWSAR